MTGVHKLLFECVGPPIASIPELGVSIIGTGNSRKAIIEYRHALRDSDIYVSTNEDIELPELAGLPYLSSTDVKLLRSEARQHLQSRARQTRPLMLRDAIRSLGRAAHYTEIAEACNRLFPEREGSTHNWHAALSLPESEALGIVWIGRKGMYGLQEHGYSRPETGIHEAVSKIVREQFARTERPVSAEVVIAELSKRRREVSRTSVTMALSFNDELDDAGMGRYVPKSSDVNADGIPKAGYDISAAFDAFRGDKDTDSPKE